MLIINKSTVTEGLKHNQDEKQRPVTENEKIQNYLDKLCNHGAKDLFWFLIEYDSSQVKFEKEKWTNQFGQLLFTKEFIVVKIGNTVLFGKLSSVLENNL